MGLYGLDASHVTISELMQINRGAMPRALLVLDDLVIGLASIDRARTFNNLHCRRVLLGFRNTMPTAVL